MNDEATKVFYELPEDLRVDMSTREKQTFIQEIRTQLKYYAVQNKGLTVGAASSYLVAMLNNKNHEEAMKDVQEGAAIGQALGKLYDWVVEKI